MALVKSLLPNTTTSKNYLELVSATISVKADRSVEVKLICTGKFAGDKLTQGALTESIAYLNNAFDLGRGLPNGLFTRKQVI